MFVAPLNRSNMFENGYGELRVSREASSEPTPSIFLRILSRPSSFAKVLVMMGSLVDISPGGASILCFNFIIPLASAHFCPTVTPNCLYVLRREHTYIHTYIAV